MSLQLAEDIIKGRRLKRGEDLSFLLSEDLDELCAGADKIRQSGRFLRLPGWKDS